MRELALIGAGRVGRAFLKIWNDREIIIVDPHVLMEDFLGYAVVDEILPGMAKTAIVAVPGDIAPKKILQCFEAGMNVVDVSFHDTDFEQFDWLAKEHGCWYIPDAGFGPGIMNMMCSRLALAYNCLSINAYIGGLPVVRTAPWYYKNTWNSVDHLAEYTRPARYIENGAVKTVMPLESDIRIMNTPYGTMEAFCSDGLRTLLENPGTANMAEFTLRWPGFIQNMQLMYQSGMLEPQTIKHFATGIGLSKQWLPAEDEQDVCALIVEARIAGAGERIRGMRMFYTRQRGECSAMSWCTAAGTAAALNMALSVWDPGDPTAGGLTPGMHTIEVLVHESKNFAAYWSMLEQTGIEIHEYNA
jgi:saccharopine dehydrogenase-like NADP-dependent oxidoreductase